LNIKARWTHRKWSKSFSESLLSAVSRSSDRRMYRWWRQISDWEQ